MYILIMWSCLIRENTLNMCWWSTSTWFKALYPFRTSVFRKALFLWIGFTSWWSQKEDCIGVLQCWLFPLCFADLDEPRSLVTIQNMWVLGWAHLVLFYVRSAEIPIEMGQNFTSQSWTSPCSVSCSPLSLYSVWWMFVKERGPWIKVFTAKA